MEGDESDRQASFKVKDRRRFSATGEAREDVPEEQAATPQAADPLPPSGGSAEPIPEAGGEITFATFIFSLSTQALANLGEIPDPADGATRVNLEGARQIIDILAMLDEKTRGNLDAAERSLLENALYDLRMRYVDRARGR
jgi:Domain of unknown function (DUF1844)